jgi:hypothetical protein
MSARPLCPAPVQSQVCSYRQSWDGRDVVAPGKKLKSCDAYPLYHFSLASGDYMESMERAALNLWTVEKAGRVLTSDSANRRSK